MTETRLIIGDSRSMREVGDSSISLVVTSPPYWHIKDYGAEGQIGYGQSLHDYLKDLHLVWSECMRVLSPGRRLCINIGDQFTRTRDFGRYKVIPIHAEIISQCEGLGFDYMGSIIWQKKTTVNTTGGAPIMGSYPYPPNGVVEIDYEYILLFKKTGSPEYDRNMKEFSRLSKEEWKSFFSGHWNFRGRRQIEHEAMFPGELPGRLIRMFTLVGETVLDPFAGSGTSIKTAIDLGRVGIGYEINPEFAEMMVRKIGKDRLRVIERDAPSNIPPDNIYTPSIPDAEQVTDREDDGPDLHRVIDINGSDRILLDNGEEVRLLGLDIKNNRNALEYLEKMVKGKEIFVKNDPSISGEGSYVYLKNRIFINRYMIKSGMAKAREDIEYTHRKKFLES